MGKSDANECNESLLSNCGVQLALSKKKDGMILELPSLMVKKYGYVFEKILLSKESQRISKTTFFSL